MKITFLGTGAAEGIPAVWCECELCKQAKMLGGKDIRRRCTYAVDDDTMIDFGPDAVRQTQDAGIDLTRLERIIFTHNHPDHLSPMELQFRQTGYFSRVSRELTVIGSCRIFSRILSFTAEDCGIYTLADLRIRPLEIRAGETVTDRGLAVTALAATHAPGKEAQLFVLERGGKRFFVANDTGVIADSELERLRGVRLDLVAVDCTMGNSAKRVDGHFGMRGVVEFRDRLRALGCLDDASQVYVNHFSHNGLCLHRDLEAFFLPRAIKVAYDGLTVEIQ